MPPELGFVYFSLLFSSWVKKVSDEKKRKICEIIVIAEIIFIYF
jgi:hypothetical protein